MMIDNTEAPAVATKTERVLQTLRGQIIQGRYGPGHRFPTFDEMSEQFQVSRSVLQEVVRRLCDDGFVVAKTRKGMHVATTLPHLTRFALVFPGSPSEPGYETTRSTVLDAAAEITRRDPGNEYIVYSDIQSASGASNLLDDVRSHRVAGLIIMPGGNAVLDKYPELSTDDMPRVFLASPARWGYRPVVDIDKEMFYRRALEALAGQKRTRVAILHMAGTFCEIDHAALYAGAGLEYHEPWIQQVGRSHPECAQSLIQLLFDARGGTVPDGLIVADDNLTEHVVAGLLRVGLRVGADLDVISYCHWPWRSPSALPIRHLGFHITDMLLRCTNVILALRRGDDVPDCQLSPALFEDEQEPESP